MPFPKAMVPEMVARMAIAFYCGSHDIEQERVYFDSLTDDQQKTLLRGATEALKAIREPTEAMAEAGHKASLADGAHDCEVPMSDVYQAMIDAALKE